MNDFTYYRKILYGLVLIGIVIMITMPDVVMGFLFELPISSLRYCLSHSSGLRPLFDHLVEDLFHTELHQTQTIVFYLLVGIFVFPLYYLGRMLLRLFFRLKETLLAEWALNKNRATLLLAGFVFNRQNQMDFNYRRCHLPGFLSVYVIGCPDLIFHFLKG